MHHFLVHRHTAVRQFVALMERHAIEKNSTEEAIGLIDYWLHNVQRQIFHFSGKARTNIYRNVVQMESRDNFLLPLDHTHPVSPTQCANIFS